MAEEKKKELDPATEKPEFLYQLTQNFMLGYIKQESIPKKDKKWFVDLCKANKKEVTRGKATFEVLDISPVRKEFAKKYFPDLAEKKKAGKKKSFFDELDELLD